MSTLELAIATPGRGMTRIDPRIDDWLGQRGIASGLVHVFAHHTSCSLMICENADPVVLADLERFFARLVKDGDPLFRHDAEGPDDMPAHVRSVLTGVSLSIPVRASRLDLGTWQGVYLWEQRQGPHRRRLTVTALPA